MTMKIHVILAISVIIGCTSEGTLFAETSDSSSRLTVISSAKERRLSKEEIQKITESESKKHAVEGYLANTNVVDCFDAISYRYTGGRFVDTPIQFRLRCPPCIEPGRVYPLIILFHGNGESSDDNTRQLGHLQRTLDLFTGPGSLDFFLLAAQCPSDNPSWTNSISNEGKGDAPLTITQEIFETLLDEYPIDKNRISVTGLSSGGAAVWEFAKMNPGRLAAIAPLSAGPPGSSFSTDAIVWAFNGIRDYQASADSMRPTIATINRKGGIAFLTEIDSGEHDTSPTALRKMKVFRWMILQKRGGMAYPPPGVYCYSRTGTTVFFLFGLPLLGALFMFTFKQKMLDIFSSRFQNKNHGNKDAQGAVQTPHKGKGRVC